MIIINKPNIIRVENNRSRLVCDITVNKKLKQVWFEVDTKYEKYLTNERSDAFLIGILSWAMRNSLDIKCLAPVTEEILYKINTYLIPSLVKNSKQLYPSKIYSDSAPALSTDNGVGTGSSCGVDSMHAIANYYNPKYKSMKLTHLCINNVGAFNECYKEYGIDNVKNERIKKAKELAKELKLPIIITDSNFYEMFPQNHLYTHTYSSMFAVHCLQKLWKIYFYGSSGYDFSQFSLKDNEINSSDHYELLSLDCLSTSNLKIYSEGGAKTRYEKTDFIKNFFLAQKYLHVCTRRPDNCGTCPKCMRTILSLDALGKLKNFKKVFDINYYKNNKKEYLYWLYNEHLIGNQMIEGIFEKFKDDLELYGIINTLSNNNNN